MVESKKKVENVNVKSTKRLAIIAFVVLSVMGNARAETITFGSGANPFTMDFSPIGDLGNNYMNAGSSYAFATTAESKQVGFRVVELFTPSHAQWSDYHMTFA